MLFRNLNWNVVGWLRTVSLISYALIGLGLAAMLYHIATTGAPLRLGLSFTGGTDVTVKFNQSVTKDQVGSALSALGVTDARINTLAKPGETGTPRWSIETQHDFGNDASSLWNGLAKVAPVDRTQSSISTVGPSLGREYLLNAAKALVIAIGIQFVYIAFRFGWNYIFGLVTIIALVRDSLMMIGIYALADKRVDDAFLAAVLTVIGYSVMDTIVILDRIRENVKVMDGEPFDKIVNASILQTMTRSVNTLATVVVTLVALLAFGGASLQNFAFALLVGICSGGYHSIFYSAPLVAQLQKRQKARARRSAELQPARTVAEARAQSGRSPAERADVIAARKARRERERMAASRQTGPARYKRRRPEPGSAAAIAEAEMAPHDAPQYDELGYEIEREHEIDHDEAHAHEIDPLDAQRAGLHDEQYELGHEEIRLNLDAVEHAEHPERTVEGEPIAHPTPEEQAQARVDAQSPESKPLP